MGCQSINQKTKLSRGPAFLWDPGIFKSDPPMVPSKATESHIRTIGDDPIAPQLQHTLDVRGIIHRPGVDLDSPLFAVAYALSIDHLVMGMDGLGAHRSGIIPGQVQIGRVQQSQWHLGVQQPVLPQASKIKGG